MIYKKRLKELRESLDLKQSDLAQILSVDKDCYGQYEREYVIIPIKHLISICNFYKVSLDYVFEFTDINIYENYFVDIDKKMIGERLKEFRKENKITQINLAQMLNVGNGTIADYERGRYIISTPVLYTICKKYNISADYLLGKVDNPKYF